MAEAWSTVVTREPEWDDFSRERVEALMALDHRTCPSCQNYMTLDPQGPTSWTVTAPDGRKFVIEALRCVTCGLEEMARRQWGDQHKDDKPNASGALASDGLMLVAQPKD